MFRTWQSAVLAGPAPTDAPRKVWPGAKDHSGKTARMGTMPQPTGHTLATVSARHRVRQIAHSGCHRLGTLGEHLTSQSSSAVTMWVRRNARYGEYAKVQFATCVDRWTTLHRPRCDCRDHFAVFYGVEERGEAAQLMPISLEWNTPLSLPYNGPLRSDSYGHQTPDLIIKGYRIDNRSVHCFGC